MLVTASFCIKAAVVPFHFAHADALAVAPVPVLALFSGIMLQLGLYGVAHTYWTYLPARCVASKRSLPGFWLRSAQPLPWSLA